MKKLIISFLLSILFAVPAWSATYYIDADAADDTGTGAVGDPWKTIGKVNSVNFANGDVVVFQAGDTFSDATLTLAAVTSGSSKFLTLRGSVAGDSFGGKDVDVDGRPWIGGASKKSVYVAGAPGNGRYLLGLTLKDLKFDGQDFDYATKTYKVELDYSGAVTVDGCVGDGSVGWNGGATAIGKICVGLLNPRGAYEIKNNTFSYWGPPALWGSPELPETTYNAGDCHAFGMAGGSGSYNASIHDNTFKNCQADGIQLNGEHTTGSLNIYNNTIWNCGENSIDVKGSLNVHVYKNHVYRDATFIGKGGSPAGGEVQGLIQILSYADNYNTPDVTANCSVHDNNVGPTDGKGISLVGSGSYSNVQDTDVYQNYIHGCQAGLYIKSTTNDCSIYNNIVDNPRVGGYFYYIYCSTCTDNIVYNNTFFSNGAANMGAGLYLRWSSGTTYKNNIFMMNDPDSYMAQKIEGGSATIDYNCWYNGAYSITLSGYSVGANGLQTDPGIHATGYYPTGAGSAVVNAGVTETGTPADGLSSSTDWSTLTIQTISRAENGGADIGAFEYSSESPPEPPPPAGGCTGTWGEDVNESFETGSDCSADTCTFCTTGMALGANGCTSGTNIIDCSDDTWAHSGTYSASIILDADTADAMKIYGDWGSAVGELWIRYYVNPGTSISGQIINFFPMTSDDTAGAHQIADAYWFGTTNGDWRVYLYGAAALSTNYFTLADGNEYRIEMDAKRNDTCTMKVFDSAGDPVLSNGAAETITCTGGDFDVQYVQFYDTYDSSTGTTFYIDDFEASAVTWVGTYSAPTIAVADIGIVTDPTGSPSFAENTTVTIDEVTDVTYLGFKLNGDVQSAGNPTRSRVPLELDNRTAYATYLLKYLDGNASVLVYTYTPQRGDRVSDLVMPAVNSLDCNTETIVDGDGNDLCDDTTAPHVDFGGTGTIDVALPYTSANPLYVGYNGDYATMTAVMAEFSLVPDDYIMFTLDITDDINTAGAGTSGHPITVDGNGKTLTGRITADEEYWTFKNMEVHP